jgi:hypothetical protein
MDLLDVGMGWVKVSPTQPKQKLIKKNWMPLIFRYPKFQ